MLCRKLVAMAGVLLLICVSRSLRADENDNDVQNGPWISAVSWLNDTEIAGTNPQGLLLRPAKLVKASADTTTELESIGESESSLWSVLPLDENRIVATDYKGGVHLYDKGQRTTFDANTRWIRALSKSPKVDEILAGTEDGKLIVLSVAQRKEARRVDAHEAAIFDIAVSSAGDKIATACSDGSIKIFSWPKLEELSEMSRGNEAVWSLVFCDDDQKIVSGGADRRIQLWDVAAATSICTISRTGDWITDLVLLPESTIVVASCMDGELVVVDHAALARVTSSTEAQSAIWAMELAPDGSRLALGTRKSGLTVLQVPDWIGQSKTASDTETRIRPPSPKH